MGGGGTAGRRLGVLVLLVAVLSMHGAQYVSAGAHAPPAATADHPFDAAVVAALPLAPVALADDLGMTMVPELSAATSVVAARTMPGHSIPAHVWSLCLAVLLAGLVLLGAALGRRKTPGLARPSVSWSRGAVPRSMPLRPPDLSVLCLLRI